MSNQTVLDYLQRLAVHNNIKVFWTDQLQSYTTPACDTHTRRVVMNTMWHLPQQIPFQLAHEISHVLISDNADRILYFSSPTNHSKIEMDANKKAVELLLPEYLEYASDEDLSATDFIEQFCIPKSLTEYAQSLLLSL